MKRRKTPAPRRAGNTRRRLRTLDDVRALLRPIAHDREALDLVANLVDLYAKRSTVCRR